VESNIHYSGSSDDYSVKADYRNVHIYEKSCIREGRLAAKNSVSPTGKSGGGGYLFSIDMDALRAICLDKFYRETLRNKKLITCNSDLRRNDTSYRRFQVSSLAAGLAFPKLLYFVSLNVEGFAVQIHSGRIARRAFISIGNQSSHAHRTPEVFHCRDFHSNSNFF
jgi:hypothetical protein